MARAPEIMKCSFFKIAEDHSFLRRYSHFFCSAVVFSNKNKPKCIHFGTKFISTKINRTLAHFYQKIKSLERNFGAVFTEGRFVPKCILYGTKERFDACKDFV